MSSFSGGGGSPEFEKLIQLATFVQGPGYLERVKELQELEASSKQALEQANVAVSAAKEAQAALEKRETAVKQREDALERAQSAHSAKVAALSKAIGEAR
jgi:multidrug resistance efflux pump